MKAGGQYREQVTKQGVLTFGAGEERACGEHAGLITVPRSVPEVLEKGMLPEVFYDSKMTSQMQEQTLVSEAKKKKPPQTDYSHN